LPYETKFPLLPKRNILRKEFCKLHIYDRPNAFLIKENLRKENDFDIMPVRAKLTAFPVLSLQVEHILSLPSLLNTPFGRNIARWIDGRTFSALYMYIWAFAVVTLDNSLINIKNITKCKES
jgi:hypothetical protein